MPITSAPARRRRSTATASCAAMKSWNNSEPCVTRWSRTQITSFTTTGTPANGGRSPRAMRSTQRGDVGIQASWWLAHHGVEHRIAFCDALLKRRKHLARVELSAPDAGRDLRCVKFKHGSIAPACPARREGWPHSCPPAAGSTTLGRAMSGLPQARKRPWPRGAQNCRHPTRVRRAPAWSLASPSRACPRRACSHVVMEHVGSRSMTSLCGSQIAMSASEPIAIVPLRGFSPYSFAGLVAVSATNWFSVMRAAAHALGEQQRQPRLEARDAVRDVAGTALPCRPASCPADRRSGTAHGRTRRW